MEVVYEGTNIKSRHGCACACFCSCPVERVMEITFENEADLPYTYNFWLPI